MQQLTDMHQFDIAALTALFVVTNTPLPENMPRWDGHNSDAFNRVQQLSANPRFKSAAVWGLEYAVDYLAEQHMITAHGWSQPFQRLPDELVALGLIPRRPWND